MKRTLSWQKVQNRLPKAKQLFPDYPDVVDEALAGDRYLGWLWRPHTTLALLVGIVWLGYAAFNRRDAIAESVVSNSQAGLAAACLAFLFFCMVQLKDGVFVRPHPALWRVVTGVAVLYLMALVYLLFQSAEEARQLLRYFDSSLGVEPPERSYATDCRIYTPGESVEVLGGWLYLPIKNVAEVALNDRFVWAHFLGWWGKTLIFRDVYLVWSMSIAFEVLELSLQHLLPNFAECWWDHVLVDVFGANFIGIVLGMLTIRLFEMKQYDWTESGWNRERGPDTPPLKRLMLQFVPRVDEFHFDWVGSWQRCLAVLLLVVLQQGSEISAFFLKFILWVPAEHNLNIVRLLIWFLLALPASRELYMYAADERCNRLHHNLWLGIAILSVETLINVKFATSERMFVGAAAPPLVKTFWLVFFAACGIVVLRTLFRLTRRKNIANANADGDAGLQKKNN
jgi:phosphatidylserine synthase 2